MANQKAYVWHVNTKSSPHGAQDAIDEAGYVHQSSPGWVLTFVRWNIRDTMRTKPPYGNNMTVRDPLVVQSDCVSVSTTGAKGTLTPSMEATLKLTDVNYETAVAPGDFVFVNMLNWEDDARKVAIEASLSQPINKFDHGFKGFYKVQAVRKIIQVDPASGSKTVFFKITGFAFTEFNNSIYLNPYLATDAEANNAAIFNNNMFHYWQSYLNKAGQGNLQEIVSLLIRSFVGEGIALEGKSPSGDILRSPNIHFRMPKAVGLLLGVSSNVDLSGQRTHFLAAKDIYYYLFGIQQYASGTAQPIGTAMNPVGLSIKHGRFFFTPSKVEGATLIKPEFWNNVKAWSIMNQYVNSPLNELYTCFRVSPYGDVMPTIVFRQIPFTSEDFEKQKFGTRDSSARSIKVTKFMNIPRWKIDPGLVIGADLGRDEAARINFVQYYGKTLMTINGAAISQEIARHNYVYDIKDVERSGLRAMIPANNFNDLSGADTFDSPNWARVVADALFGGHLKMNGTLNCIGIVDPISVGDNLEFDGVVYHIEQVSHNCQVNPETGEKAFRTSLSLSMGMSVDSDEQGTQYPEMSYPNGYDARAVDGQNNAILPGISEAQDVLNRPDDVDPSKIDNLRSAPYPQPNVKKKNSLSKKEKDKK